MDSRRPFPIALVMIVRDEESRLGRCLGSVEDLVDEIVVVDTGSVDRTVELARSYGARIGHFTWVDDFAAARNHALSLTTQPWRLILDADQWIADPVAAAVVLDRLSHTPPRFIGMVDAFEARADGTLNTDAVPFREARLLPDGVRYTGRVHEQPTPRDRLEHVALAVGHDGYRPEAMARKEERNTALLVAALTEEPENAYLWYQLGSEFAARGHDAEALPHLVQAFNLTHPADGAVPPPRTWWHRLTIRLMRTLTRLGRHDEATAVGEMESARWSESSDFHYVLGQTMRAYAGSLDPSRDALAHRLILASLDLWIRAVELGDRPEYTGVLAGRATVLAARALAEDFETMGRSDDAARYRAIA